MPQGQQFLVHYVRGDTNRSTPCYQANNGVVDFRNMPEGAAILHFKKGKGKLPNGRSSYAPKYIQLKVDEYFPRSARRTVGETQVDCSTVMQDATGSSGSGILISIFHMYGTTATMKVAVLIYRKEMLPLTFESLLGEDGQKAQQPAAAGGATAAAKEAQQKKEGEKVKTMSREEAKILLISLEALQDRRNREGASATGAFPELEKEVQRLENKRKTMVGTEGLANQVVSSRCKECIAAQFRALRMSHRANYIGTTAAYLRQMSLTHHYVSEETVKAMEDKERQDIMEKLRKGEHRLATTREKMKAIEEEQMVLQQSDSMDYMDQMIENIGKLEALQKQEKVLMASQAGLKEALASPPATKAALQVAGGEEGGQKLNPLQAEIEDIKNRINRLAEERSKLSKKVNHMNSVAITNVLIWARGKNAEEEAKPVIPTVDDLFDKPTPAPPPPSQEVTAEERQKLLDGFASLKGKKDEKKKKSDDSSASTSSSSSDNDDDDDDDDDDANGGFVPPGMSRNMFSSGFQEKRKKEEEDRRPNAAKNFFRDATDEERQRYGKQMSPEPEEEEDSAPPSSLPGMPAPNFGGGKMTAAQRRALDPTYDEMEDFSPGGGGSHLQLSDSVMAYTNEPLDQKANRWFSPHDGGRREAAESSSSSSSEKDDSDEDNAAPAAGGGNRYNFGSGDMDYQSFYSGKAPQQYNFGN